MEKNFRQQREWQNQIEAEIKQQQRKEGTFETGIARLEDYQRSTRQTVIQQQYRIRYLSERQNTLQATIQQDKESTTALINNISSNIRRLREETR